MIILKLIFSAIIGAIIGYVIALIEHKFTNKQSIEDIELIKITFPKDKAYLVDENVTTFAGIVGEMTNLYAKKNHDYGNSFDEGCDKIGTGYPLGRLLDKMNRLIACMGKEDEMQVNESIEDTLTDLACYSVMTLSYLKRKKNG